jgi:hypothetical protein
MVSSVEVAHGELDEFVLAYRRACAEALSPSPRVARGDWCRFCAARPICPAHTAPLLDLATLRMPVSFEVPKEEYLKALGAGLALVDACKDIGTALRDQAKRALDNGDSIPGYALSQGRAERSWRDEHETLTPLESLGMARVDLVTEKLRSPKQIEIRAKARALRVPPELIVSTRSGCSLTRIENAHAPVPGRVEFMRDFSAALAAFQKGGRS